MSFADDIEEEMKREDAYRAEWRLGEYTGKCEKCRRERLCICENGKHRCEKCNWCPEDSIYIDA
jgi:hypothetical protein